MTQTVVPSVYRREAKGSFKTPQLNPSDGSSTRSERKETFANPRCWIKNRSMASIGRPSGVRPLGTDFVADRLSPSGRFGLDFINWIKLSQRADGRAVADFVRGLDIQYPSWMFMFLWRKLSAF
ncbi:family 2 glycosyl transferase [Anopheles sinensis]|uniref:Family 2 glycosyl transferase n=1 Tax=Anopheles sinensis TaxID=74873 RepID=A0A084WGP4_ANOSI|nr:family 2 glycosyl transferase [Anopheles sinensis]